MINRKLRASNVVLPNDFASFDRGSPRSFLEQASRFPAHLVRLIGQFCSKTTRDLAVSDPFDLTRFEAAALTRFQKSLKFRNSRHGRRTVQVLLTRTFDRPRGFVSSRVPPSNHVKDYSCRMGNMARSLFGPWTEDDHFNCRTLSGDVWNVAFARFPKSLNFRNSRRDIKRASYPRQAT